MARLLSCLAIVCVLLAGTAPSRAVVDLETAAIPDRPLEILVVEISNCLYCGLFRRDVAPTYKASARGRAVPMRFIDINAPDVDRLALQSPIDSVPTVLVVENGREVGRIAGYVGPEFFFHSLNRILPDTGP
jgi:thioredoxin-related protein